MTPEGHLGESRQAHEERIYELERENAALKAEVARYFRDHGWTAEGLRDNGFPGLAGALEEGGQ